MKNYVMIDYAERTKWAIQPDITDILKRHKPRDCPLENYTMFDLLIDWIQIYSWQLDRNREYSLTEFVNTIHKNGKKTAYVLEMLELLSGN